MRWGLQIGFMLLFLLPVSSLAQEEEKPFERITKEPICFQLINQAPYSVNGRFGTDKYTRPDGVVSRHRSNFRLKPAGTKHEEGYPLDRAEFCSYGPFFPGYKLDLTLRTLVPIFDCKTSIIKGPIMIEGGKKSDGSTVTTAKCFD